MEVNVKVSIIVAAYNIENYIDKCIESLVNQTLEDIEIIIVNDGSTDGTLKKINKKASEEKRIIVINQENQGVMSARDTGVKHASGKYLLLVDGDDWLAEDCVEKLYYKAIQDNSDIICYKFIWIDEDNKEIKSHLMGGFITFDKKKDNEFLKSSILLEIAPSLWSKLIRRDFIVKNNINFNNGLRYAEDLALSCELGMYMPKVSMLNEHLYYYYQRNGSVTKSICKNAEYIDNSIMKIKDNLEKNKLYDEFEKEFEYLCFTQNYIQVFKIITNFKMKNSKVLYERWKKYKIRLYDNAFIKRKLKMENRGYRLAINIVNINYYIGKFYYFLRRL